jgi:PAS domain S-box-containing protein
MDENGKVVLLIPESRDITDRKRAEDEIHREKALLRCIIDSIGDLIFIKDMNGFYQACNKASEEFIGLPESEQIGKTDFDFFDRDVAETIRECDLQILASGKEGHLEEWVTYRDGRRGLFDTVKTPFYGPDGKQQGLVGISRDITERKRADDQLRKLWRAVEQSPATIVITDTTGKIEYVNQKFAELTGYTRGEAVGNNPRILKTEHTPRAEYTKLWCTISTGGEWRGEFQNKKKNGELYWESATISPILNERGEITHFLAIKEDITEHKQMQVQLEQSLSLLRATLESTADGILVVDSDGRFTSHNHKFQEMWGIPDSVLQAGADDQALAYVMDKLLNPETFISGVRAFYEQPEAESFDVIKFLDGRTFERYSNPQRIGGRIVGRVWSFRDITEQKRMEEALRESEERYKALIDLSPDAIFIRTGGRMTFVNNEGAKLLGVEQPEDIYGREALDVVHPDSRELVAQRMAESLRTGTPNPPVEIILVRVDGSQVPVEVASVPFRYKGEISILTIARDITDRKRMQDELLKTQKLESLGVLAGGIAHDFNNILTAIIGNVSLARMQVGEGHKAASRLAASENALARATDLTRQLLTFARGGEPIKKVIEVGGLLKEAASFAIHGSTVKCQFILPDDLWLVEADAGQLSQVIQNLVINARQAMPEGGTLTLEAENIRSLQEGKRFVHISVVDRGAGIPKHHLQRIFDPYFTTKQLGSGLGLATCYSIIKRHDGNITVKSTLGKGSTFYVDLPASEQGSAVEAGLNIEVVYGSGRVLVMDDEEQVREATQAMLEELGYTVECAKNGSDTVDLYRQRKEEGTPFSVVIMDLTIPGGMGGKEAINLLLKLDPNVKAIVSSGYSADPVMANYREYGFVSVLRKPYRPQEMSAILHDCFSSDDLQPSLFD